MDELDFISLQNDLDHLWDTGIVQWMSGKSEQ